MIIVDAHEDLAWNIQTFKRDYMRSVAETRALEVNTETIVRNGTTLLGWPEWVKGRVAVIFATLFVAPGSRRMGEWEANCYTDPETAHRLYWSQVELYHRLVDAHADKLHLIQTQSDLEQVLATWSDDSADSPRVGLVILMEGADGVREPAEVQKWYEAGVRLIGPAWTATRYAGGTGAPGPFTDQGRQLLREMADLNMVLDLSHLSDEGALEALDRYPGPLIASHSNARALLMPGSRAPERHLSDEAIVGIAERDGVIGIVLGNAFLKGGWMLSEGRAPVTLDHVTAQIDYMCQLIGDAQHVGIGSDFDGGIGLEKTPTGIDTVADLPLIGDALAARGYRPEDIEAILGGNWLRLLRRTLP